MQEISFFVTGRRPLLMHSAKAMQRSEEKVGRKKIPTPEVEAENGAYRLPNGNLYMPSEAFAGSVRKAASGLKIGKVNAKVVLSAGLFFLDEFCPVVHPKTKKPLKDYVIDTRRAVVQNQGILRSRPRLNEWACEVRCEYDADILNEGQILEIFSRAGLYIGVGDQRPGAPKTPGQFGTYTVAIEKKK